MFSPNIIAIASSELICVSFLSTVESSAIRWMDGFCRCCQLKFEHCVSACWMAKVEGFQRGHYPVGQSADNREVIRNLNTFSYFFFRESYPPSIVGVAQLLFDVTLPIFQIYRRAQAVNKDR